ncbi:DUF1444 family protein [Longispora albida]|uniref:DUF1444 family protein n=1 Tax=Longispora albida TaxID=203523 RepID=UPI000372A466|nr:DUF1444 family protein [Longispora albida]
MQVTHTTFLPLIRPRDGEPGDIVTDDFAAGLTLAYTFGPPYGERLVTTADLSTLGLGRCMLREQATSNLAAQLGRVRLHGGPHAFMLSFDGMESSLLAAGDALWEQLGASVSGELIVGVPARDVVVVTGSASAAGLDKARRTVDRVFFAGDENLLSDALLVWREGCWQQF